MNIGDIFLRVLADDAGFAADLTTKAGKAGDEAGATLGQRMGAAVKQNGAKIIGATLAIAGAVAAKGVLELQNVVADFRAETGATADEADRAKKAILGMASRNVDVSLSQIGQTLTKVHTDMGLTGDEASRVTELFLRFGRVTHDEPAVAVAAFDDILDSWNLTASDTLPIMDALLASHQKYGGVVSNDEAALASLAPVLKAVNLSWRDGVALINLFKNSGVETSDMVAALTKALSKVHSPEEFQKLIADIIATEDPLKRAALASDLFGAKAGPKLANVLKPGIDGIDAFNQSNAETAGTLDASTAALDSTFGARFQHLLAAAGAAIIEFGDTWGGLATVIATALTIAGPVAGKLSGPLIGGLKGAWAKAAASSAVQRVISIASDKAATGYLKALIAGDAIGGALSKAWAATGGRLIAAAGVQGSLAGRAFAIGAAAAIVAAPAAVIVVGIQIAGDIKKQTEDLANQLGEFVKTATYEQLVKAREGVAAQLAALPNDPIADALGLSARKGIEDTLKGLDAAIARHNRDASAAMVPAAVAFSGLASTARQSFSAVDLSGANLARAIKSHADGIALSIKGLTATLLGEAQALITGYYDPLIEQDQLRIQQSDVTAAEVARNATKAGTAERTQADLTLLNAKKALEQTRLNLLATGKLTAADQKKWLADLEADYKTSTGTTKTYIGQLIDKIHALQNVPTTIVDIVARITSKVVKSGGPNQPRESGGPVIKGHDYLVNENTPKSEIWTPEVSGYVHGPAATPAHPESAAASGHTITIYNPEPRAADEDVGRMLRRIGALGL